jgi:hypothetical protein
MRFSFVSSAADAPHSSTVQPSGSGQPSNSISVLAGAGVADTGAGLAPAVAAAAAAVAAAAAGAAPPTSPSAIAAVMLLLLLSEPTDCACAAADVASCGDASSAMLPFAAAAGCCMSTGVLGSCSTLNLLQLPTSAGDSSSSDAATCTEQT